MSIVTEAIRSRGFLIGTLVSIASPVLAEALSRSGLDWLFYDLEHSVMNLMEVQTMIQAMDERCLSLIRLEEASPVYVKKALDTGCSGIIVPQVNSVGTAKAVVAAGKFPPLGARGMGLSRCFGYGMTLQERIPTENARTPIIVQIEHMDAVHCVEEIAEVEGVDGLFIGPYDLSGSLGIPGNTADPKVQEAIERTIQAGRAVNKPVGIFADSVAVAKRELARGVSFVAVGADVLRLVTATQEICKDIRGSRVDPA